MDIDYLIGLDEALDTLIYALEEAEKYPELEGLDLSTARALRCEVGSKIDRFEQAEQAALCVEYERGSLYAI